MGFDRSQALTNANSKCLRIERVLADRDRPVLDRMAIVAAIVREYEEGVPEWARPSEAPPEYRNAPGPVVLAGQHEWPCPHFYIGMAAYDPGRPCTCCVTCDECHRFRLPGQDCTSPHCVALREEAEAAFAEPPC